MFGVKGMLICVTRRKGGQGGSVSMAVTLDMIDLKEVVNAFN
jgi:hypothetical protein